MVSGRICCVSDVLVQVRKSLSSKTGCSQCTHIHLRDLLSDS
jgi:hypothetical protein